jgi:hypothetical protein
MARQTLIVIAPILYLERSKELDRLSEGYQMTVHYLSPRLFADISKLEHFEDLPVRESAMFHGKLDPII